MENNSGNYSDYSQAAEFATVFDRVKQLGNSEPDDLPDNIQPLVKSERDVAALFESAYQAWQATFDRIKLEAAVKGLLSDDASFDQRERLLQYLAEVRQIGFILQSAWICCDARHQAPEFHSRLVTALGRLKDALRYTLRTSPAVAADNLRMCLDAYPGLDPDPRALFQPADKAAFAAEQGRMVAGFQDVVRLERMPARLLHQVRKNSSRPLMNMFLLATLRNGDPEAREVYLWLRSIDHELGKKHNAIMDGTVTADDEQAVDERTKQRVRAFIAAAGDI